MDKVQEVEGTRYPQIPWDESHADHDEFGWGCNWCGVRFCQECEPATDVDGEGYCDDCIAKGHGAESWA